MDEAAAKIRIEINSKPEELDILDRKIMQLEIEIEAIKREKDEVKLKTLRSDLANIKEERNSLHAKWKSEKVIVDAIQNTKIKIETFFGNTEGLIGLDIANIENKMNKSITAINI